MRSINFTLLLTTTLSRSKTFLELLTSRRRKDSHLLNIKGSLRLIRATIYSRRASFLTRVLLGDAVGLF